MFYINLLEVLYRQNQIMPCSSLNFLDLAIYYDKDYALGILIMAQMHIRIQHPRYIEHTAPLF